MAIDVDKEVEEWPEAKTMRLAQTKIIITKKLTEPEID